MGRELVPGIVVTVSTLTVSTLAVSTLAGCPSAPPPQNTSTTATTTETTTPATTATVVSTAQTPRRTRAVTRPNFQRRDDQKISLAGMTVLNPTHEGRTVMTDKRGGCYIMLPPGADSPPAPPGSRIGARQDVDCPESMDDPAWDSCLDDQLAKVASGECVCLASYGNPPPPPSQAECPIAHSELLTIEKNYTGRFGFPTSADHRTAAAPVPSRIIRDAAGFAEFVKMIPPTKITKRQPSPPSDDPLLKRPSIDWTKHMMIVAFRTDTMYLPPKVENPRLDRGKLVIDVRHPPLGDTANAAAVYGIGTYNAIIVERHGGDLAARATTDAR